MDSPYSPPESVNETRPAVAVEPAARRSARTLGVTTVMVGLAAAFIGWNLDADRFDSHLVYWPLLAWGACLVVPSAVVISGLAAIALSFGEQRSRMLGLGIGGILFALLVIVGQFWAVHVAVS